MKKYHGNENKRRRMAYQRQCNNGGESRSAIEANESAMKENSANGESGVNARK